MIKFRDRTLQHGEISHYYCDICGAEIHPDMIDNHECSRFHGIFKDKKI